MPDRHSNHDGYANYAEALYPKAQGKRNATLGTPKYIFTLKALDNGNRGVIAFNFLMSARNKTGVVHLALVFERHLDPCAILVYLAVFDGHVEFRYLTDPEIPQACSATLDGLCDCVLPRFAARSDFSVNAFGPSFVSSLLRKSR